MTVAPWHTKSVPWMLAVSKAAFLENYLAVTASGLEITAGQWTMSELIWELTGLPFVLPVMLTGHI